MALLSTSEALSFMLHPLATKGSTSSGLLVASVVGGVSAGVGIGGGSLGGGLVSVALVLGGCIGLFEVEVVVHPQDPPFPLGIGGGSTIVTLHDGALHRASDGLFDLVEHGLFIVV